MIGLPRNNDIGGRIVFQGGIETFFGIKPKVCLAMIGIRAMAFEKRSDRIGRMWKL